VNAPITVATNKNRAAKSTAGKFRWDFHNQLAEKELRVPKLATCRPEEIDEMFEYFLDEIHKRHPGKNRLKTDRDIILPNSIIQPQTKKLIMSIIL
jgi:DNA-binding NtrC family response regulator